MGGGEFEKLHNTVEQYGASSTFDYMAKLPSHVTALVILGCLVGTGIGYSGWWCRDKVSATSFTLIGVLNKCITVFMNVIIWDQHATPFGIASLFLCLIGGSFYQQAPMRKDQDKIDKDLNESNTKSVDIEASTPNKEDDLMRPLVK